MIISFTGHALIPFADRIKSIVKQQIKSHTNGGHIQCYLGGYGDFDKLCASACRELKQEIIDIEIIYVTPYIDLSVQKKIQEMQKMELYDTSIYPPIENVPPKLAILKRNEWMMSNADLVIAYVDHNYGGAYKSLQIAKRKKKKIINICNML